MFVVTDEIEEYVLKHTRPESEIQKQIRLETEANLEAPQMLTGAIEGSLLRMLVALVQPKLAVEIGTFSGYSALSIAAGLPEEGRLITCDINPVAHEVASRYVKESPLASKIDLRLQPALEVLQSIDEPIDFAFIDADKTGYRAYFESLMEKSRPGSLFVFDNMLWSGQVLDPQDEDSRALAELNQLLVADERVDTSFLTVRDGVQVVRVL